MFYTNITTGIFAQEEQHPVSVYPNPVNGQLHISFSEEAVNAKVQLMDAQGKCVREFEMNGFASEIETGELENGFYILSVTGRDKTIIARKEIIISR